MYFNEQFLQRVLPDAQLLATKMPDDVRFSVDTRSLQKGDIFIALPGARVDGHSFIQDAYQKGAAGLIVASESWPEVQTACADCVSYYKEHGFLLVASDTLQALFLLARAWRSYFSYPVIAITGSVGKTSTKQLLAKIIERHGTACMVAHGNQNTAIGISLNILRMRPEHKVALFEVGINRRGEMRQLAALLKPTTGLITGIGHAHMEGLGSLHDIALEKRDLFSEFTETSIGIVLGDQTELAAVSYKHPIIKFGTKTINQIQARKVRMGGDHVQFVLKVYKQKYDVRLAYPHRGSVFNALAATALAYHLDIPMTTIIEVLQEPLKIAGRFEFRALKPATGLMINDCYNANPESMKAALLALQEIQTRSKKIAVLGDMMELGANGPFWHRQIGRFLRKVTSLQHLILVGDMVAWIRKTAPVGLSVETAPNWEAAQALLERQLDKEESVVLVKGSRGMQLNRLVEELSE